MAGFRNVLVHGYVAVDAAIVRDVLESIGSETSSRSSDRFAESWTTCRPSEATACPVMFRIHVPPTETPMECEDKMAIDFFWQ